MPCYNAGKYIREAIESVVNQTYTDWELIIINDGSTDDSQQVAENYIQISNHQSQIRLINQTNSGACVARNRGIQESKGEYIKFLDADDILMPTCLEEQVQQIQTLQSNQIPFGYYGNVNETGNLISIYKYPESSIKFLSADSVAFFVDNWRILISCPLHRREQLILIHGFDETLSRSQELDLHFRLALADVKFVFFETYTFQYRDYVSSDRISSINKVGSLVRVHAKRKYVLKQELLLRKKYGYIPQKYHAGFARFWFVQCRDVCAEHKYQLAHEYRGYVLQYPKDVYTSFMRWYFKVGNLIGFQFLETILRIRLKLLHK